MAGVEASPRSIGDWTLGQVLGSGSFAVVWKAQHRITGQVAAVKEINLTRLTDRLRQSLESEIAILRCIKAPNIVQLYSVIESHGRLYLIMEYCAGGDLSQVIKSGGRLSEGVVRAMMSDLAAGLREMWSRHLVHRDLKPQNLLLMAPLMEDSQSMRPPTLKIADFGFARALGPQLMAETLCGSPLYMAPEILLSQKYDAKADLWSVGAILYEMLSGHPPYTGANQVVLLRNIREREAKLAHTIASELTPACTSLVHSLLKRHAVERLSFEEFFRHPFIAGAFEPVVGFKGTALHTFGSEKPSFDGTSAPTPLPVGQLTAQLHTRGPRLVSMQRPTVVQPHPCMLGRSQNSAADDEKDPQGEDDDYVLVTASATELPQNTFEIKDPQVGGKKAQRDASRGGELQEAFLLHASVTTAPANKEGGTTLDRTVPWQASSRRQFFAHVAGILCSSNIEEAVRQDRTQSVDNLKHGSTSDLATELSFHLAALQLYAYALEGRPRLPITGVRGSMHSSNESADDGLVDGHAIHDSVIAAMERSDALVAAVQAKASKQAVLPNPWDACYHAALKWAEEAATEEILGNYQRGEALYARAGAVLHFLGAETASLPPNHVLMFCSSTVGKDERQMKQLRRCTAAIAVRWAVCAALSVQSCHTLL